MDLRPESVGNSARPVGDRNDVDCSVMTATLADPVSEVVQAAETLLTRRTGAPVTLADPVDLGGSGRSVVLRVRVAANPFSLPRTLVLKQVPPARGAGQVDLRGAAADEEVAFLREAVSYQFATALAKDHRPGAELLAYDFETRLLVLSDLGDATPLATLLRSGDTDTVGNTLMALAQALGRMHAATVGREEDFSALLRRAGVVSVSDAVAEQAVDAVQGVPELLATDFGLTVPPSVLDRAERAAKLFTGGRFRAFSLRICAPTTSSSATTGCSSSITNGVDSATRRSTSRTR